MSGQPATPDGCPHCGHGWSYHAEGRCTWCGCMWEKPKPPAPPPPPPDPLVVAIHAAIFDELDRQHEAGEIDAAGYWDREWGRLDGEPDWGAVVAAVAEAVRRVL